VTTGFLWHELFAWHNTGNYALVAPHGFPVQPGEHVEHPETKRRLRNLLDASGLLKRLTLLEPRPARDEEILRVHSRAHLERVRSHNGELAHELGPTAVMGRGSFDIAMLAAGGCIEAVDAVVQGRLTNGAGQICCAVKQVLVADSVYDEFIDQLLKKVELIKMGDPLDEQTDLGPLISERAAERVNQDVERSIAMGAKCLAGGKRVGKNFYAPTVLVNVSSKMPCLCDEVFGPVAPIARFKEIGKAIEEVNNTPYGLQASVFSDNIHDALGVAHRLEVGGVVVNGAGAFRPGNVPFGGFKLSGIGRESIKDTVREMTQETAIVLNQRTTF